METENTQGRKQEMQWLRRGIAIAIQNRGIYLKMAGHSAGAQRELLLKLYAAERRTEYALKGIRSLFDSNPITVEPAEQAAQMGKREQLLRCLERTQTLEWELMSRSAEGKLGAVCALLGQRQTAQKLIILELLGELGVQ